MNTLNSSSGHSRTSSQKNFILKDLEDKADSGSSQEISHISNVYEHTSQIDEGSFFRMHDEQSGSEQAGSRHLIRSHSARFSMVSRVISDKLSRKTINDLVTSCRSLQQKKFLAIPSFFAGISLGLNNFLLGLISDQGISSAFIFSLGAINFALSFRLLQAFKNKKKIGKFWDIEKSNLFYHDGQGIKANVQNWWGLALRVFINILFQSTTMLAFMYAQKAGINQGLITSLFSTYCVFTSVIFYFLFNEKLKLKFIVGISLMLNCVVLVCYSKYIESQSAPIGQTDIDENKTYYSAMAIALGILTPFLISIFISVSKYWSQIYGYRSIDYTVDTFFCMGLIEIGFFINHQQNVGYSLRAIFCGIGASFGQIIGTLLMIYASTYGLAGPSSAMVQVQGLFHTLMGVIFLQVFPTGLQVLGLTSAILGAIVMSVDIQKSCNDKYKKIEGTNDEES